MTRSEIAEGFVIFLLVAGGIYAYVNNWSQEQVLAGLLLIGAVCLTAGRWAPS